MSDNKGPNVFESMRKIEGIQNDRFNQPVSGTDVTRLKELENRIIQINSILQNTPRGTSSYWRLFAEKQEITAEINSGMISIEEYRDTQPNRFH